jgi:HJR/Mrr/RecB family endonuclease
MGFSNHSILHKTNIFSVSILLKNTGNVKEKSEALEKASDSIEKMSGVQN